MRAHTCVCARVYVSVQTHKNMQPHPAPSPAPACAGRTPPPPGVPPVRACRVYELYSDFVLKNPFYETEQVIKCELFDEAVDALVRRYAMQGA